MPPGVGPAELDEARGEFPKPGLVADEPAAAQWLLDQLHLAQGRSDLPLVAAALDAWLHAAADHTVALNFPEGEYLKGLLCRVVA